MIRHIVLIRLRPDATDAAFDALLDGLRALIARLPGVRGFTGGRSSSPEGIERGYRHGFVADFDDWDALRRYADHPGHRALAARIEALARGGRDGILVFDLDVPG